MTIPLDPHTRHKSLLAPLRLAMRDFAEVPVRAALDRVFAPGARVRMCHPFGDLAGPQALYEAAYAPLVAAMPDLERRDYIVVAGPAPEGEDWVGCAGDYVGTFERPFLDVPASGHVASFRFHEFFRFVEGRVVEMQAIWDLPELMMEARAWPLAPSLGAERRAPAPATQDGLVPGPYDAQAGAASCAHIVAMLQAMIRHPGEGGPEVMELERFWHPRFTWYGPAGIGTARGVRGFRNWHQIPFLAAMPDRGRHPEGTSHHFFGDGPYAAVTGWPNMQQTLTGGGWLGLPATGRRITLRSLDFWRLEDGLIRENWVLVDLLDAHAQLGLDVLARMRAFNKARPGFDRETGRALA
ncbi:ester cyclase [Salinarimonas ramus]|uniref:Polyketide cyclase n=1 Tax=Salinarimonas ramus TaxID=690164 RepID=A0A917V2W8_9HYPH|nr:ester cyclase [Salinarimonas ramus]GGK26268.1 polyketide cyclase [Salinarimonas ramus]